MKQKSPPQRHKRPAAHTGKPQPRRPQISLGSKNYVIMAAGLVAVIVGFITLARGSMTLAPLLLVLGYCVLIPVALLVR